MDNTCLTGLVLLLVAVSLEVHAYSGGAGTAACDNLTPVHGPAAQTIVSPYNVTVSNTTYSPGQPITVTLSGSPPFLGFLMQARSPGTLDAIKHGTFTIPATETANVQTKTCGTAANSVTHVSSSSKTSITVDWNPPSALVGEIIFRATFVQEQATFWVDVQSVTLTEVLVSTGSDNATLTPETGSVTQTDTADPPTTQPSSTQAPSGLKYDPACATEKGCFHNPGCSETSCEFIVSYRNNSHEDLDFTFKARALSNENHYMAIGFSADDKMGDDGVIACIWHSGKLRVLRSRNNGKSNELLTTDAEAGLSKVVGSGADGIFSCSFTSKIVVAGNTNIPDLSQEWRLFFAQGSAPSANKLSYHGEKSRFISPQKVNLLIAGSHGGDGQINRKFVQAHGSLMIIAWAFLASIGIVMARFYKPMWPNTKLLGTGLWFQLHRGCMILAFICNAIAFIIIFVDVGGYSSFTTDWHAGHPIMGIIVTILSITNPIMSMFRCHPGTPKRPLFNWAHWAVGMSAWILGIIAICFGLKLDRVMAYAYTNTVWVMVGLVCYQSLFFIILEITQCYVSKESQRNESYELKPVGDKAPDDQKPSPPASKLKTFLLILHFVIVLAFSIALIVLINVEDLHDHDH